jgi:hypothetical protein
MLLETSVHVMRWCHGYSALHPWDDVTPCPVFFRRLQVPAARPPPPLAASAAASASAAGPRAAAAGPAAASDMASAVAAAAAAIAALQVAVVSEGDAVTVRLVV